MKETMHPLTNEAVGADNPPETGPSNFIREIILDDLKTNKYAGRVHTRFPPEPNGYLHIGHAKSISLNFGLAQEFGGKCNLRFDDTNPSKEETEYVDSIIEDVRWLGGDWEGRLFYASDYFGQLYDWAVQLIKSGKAYVCDLTPDEVRRQRGTLTEPGQESPYRVRAVEENLDLFARMKAGVTLDQAQAQLTVFRNPGLVATLTDRGKPDPKDTVPVPLNARETQIGTTGKPADTRLWSAFVLSGSGRR